MVRPACSGSVSGKRRRFPPSRQLFFLLASSLATLVLLAFLCNSSFPGRVLAAQSSRNLDSTIPVRFTDVRESAKITFRQDATQTEEKYYLETVGTGVAWIDYDQDGLMDLYFVQSAATEFYKPPHPIRSSLYHNNGDGTFTDV